MLLMCLWPALTRRTCSNPAGITLSAERKHAIYNVCRKWGLLICEDDPCELELYRWSYSSRPDCYLQIRPNGADSPIVPTFMSMDPDGRVIRVDSFSKIVAPGARLGFVTGPTPLVEKIMNTRESATVSVRLPLSLRRAGLLDLLADE